MRHRASLAGVATESSTEVREVRHTNEEYACTGTFVRKCLHRTSSCRSLRVYTPMCTVSWGRITCRVLGQPCHQAATTKHGCHCSLCLHYQFHGCSRGRVFTY